MKKLRILEILIIIATIKITPMLINYTNEIRHYKAIGGEYLTPLFGILIVIAIETIIDVKEQLN